MNFGEVGGALPFADRHDVMHPIVVGLKGMLV